MSGTKYNYKNLKNDFSYDKLYNELVKNGMTYRELQEKYIYNERLFSKLAKEYNIPKNYKNITKHNNLYNIKDIDIEEITYLYNEEFLSIRAIAKIYECGKGAIKNILEKNNIEIRPFNDKHYYINRYKKSDSKCIDSNGYIIIDGEREHRIVMEKVLGRKLLPKEHVHHIDMNRQNNTLDNLFLFSNNKIHLLYHGYIRRYEYINPSIFVEKYLDLYNDTILNYSWLYNQYITLNKSIKKISEELEVSRTCISSSLNEFGIYQLRKATKNQYI